MTKPRVRITTQGWTRDVLLPPPAVEGFRASYDAGSYSKRTAEWDEKASNEGPTSRIARQLDTMRNRCRHEARNNPAIGRISDFLVTSIVGDGLKPNLKGFNDPVFEKVMGYWMDQADAEEIHDFVELQSLAVREMIEGGEVFTLFRPRKTSRDNHLVVPLQLQLLSGEFCPTHDMDTNSKAGIIFGGPGRRSAYRFYQEHPGEYLYFQSKSPMMIDTYGADMVAHLFDKRNVGQIRGVPWMARGLIAAHDLDAYLDAALVRQKLNAMVTWWVETPSADAGADGPVEHDEEGNPLDENGDPWVPTNPVDLIPEVVPGAVVPTPPGYKVVTSAPTEVGGQFDSFTRRQLQRICQSMSVPYELVFEDTVSSGERLVRLRHRKFHMQVKYWRRMLVSKFCRPAWSRAVDALALTSDWSPAPGKTLDDYKHVEWIGSPPEHIHPKQEAETHLLEIEGRLKAPSEVILERGGDPDAVFRQWAEDFKKMEQLGIAPEAFKSMIQGVRTSEQDDEANR